MAVRCFSVVCRMCKCYEGIREFAGIRDGVCLASYIHTYIHREFSGGCISYSTKTMNDFTVLLYWAGVDHREALFEWRGDE